MSRYYACDWCGFQTTYADDVVSLSINDPSFSRGTKPATMHICPDCLPGTPMADLIVNSDDGPDLDALPEVAREDFVAVMIDGKTHEEQAEDRGVGEQAVKQNIHRANRILAGDDADD